MSSLVASRNLTAPNPKLVVYWCVQGAACEWYRRPAAVPRQFGRRATVCVPRSRDYLSHVPRTGDYKFSPLNVFNSFSEQLITHTQTSCLDRTISGVGDFVCFSVCLSMLLSYQLQTHRHTSHRHI